MELSDHKVPIGVDSGGDEAAFSNTLGGNIKAPSHSVHRSQAHCLLHEVQDLPHGLKSKINAESHMFTF